MFERQIYECSNFADLYSKSLNRNIIKHFQISKSERSLLINILHMILGMPSQIFSLKSDQDCKEKYFTLVDRSIQLEHLSPLTLGHHLQKIISFAKQLQYAKYQAKRLFSIANLLLKAFFEKIFEITCKIQIDFTKLLKTLQQQGGALLRNQEEYKQSQANPITLLSLINNIRQHEQILSFIVATLNKLCLSDSSSVQEYQKSVIFLLNIYYEECNLHYCKVGTGNKDTLHVLFRGLVRQYFDICKEWLLMNESTLAMKINLGFFIDLDQVVRVEQEKMFDIKRIVKREYIPTIFSKNYNKIIELGKTIQFIKLYFGPQDKEMYRLYMNIQGQFQPLFSFLDSISTQKRSQYQFFNPKPLNYQSISKRLSTLIRPTIKSTKVDVDNPYKIYPELSGFIPLRSNYSYRHIVPITQSITMLEQNHQKGPDIESMGINSKIKEIFDQILQKISNKCLAILQKDRLRQSIQRTLIGIKKFMLFQQGDFLHQFIQLSKNILDKPSEKISRNNVQRLIEEAILSSGAKNESLTIKQNISFTFLRTEQGLKGWRIFSLMYKPEKPTNCIFTAKVMESYSYVSNLLFNLRHCQLMMIELWNNYLKQGMGMILKARNAIHHYIKALESFIFLEIQIVWAELLESFNQNGNILTVIETNQNVLQKMKSLTIQNRAFCNCMLSLIKIVDRFESIRSNLQQGRQDSIRSDLDQIWSWFLSILDQSRQINNFCDTFDFRGDYTN